MSAERPAKSSTLLFERARRVIPGGVNSPVRSFNSVGGEPVYIKSGKGARLLIQDGIEMIDFCGSWGALLFGHSRPEICEAVCSAARNGTSFGANTEREVEFAERLTSLVPEAEMVRLLSSGTEAVMTAVRLARGFTGRTKLLKFSGCYHGHADSVLVQGGSGLLTHGIAACKGVPDALASEVLVAPYNSAEAVQELVEAYGKHLAAIIVEPVAANMGVVPPQPGFLKSLQDAAGRCGAVLIFDEVITGFRFGPTTYAGLNGLKPDLVCMGKIIGGGMPLAAVGGRSEIMNLLSPVGPVYQAGTLSGNPVAVAAGLATLNLIEAEPPYEHIARLGSRLVDGLARVAKNAGVEVTCSQSGSMFTPFFMPKLPQNLQEVKEADVASFAAFFHGMLAEGIYLPPAQFEAGFVSSAHTDADVDTCISGARKALPLLRSHR